MVLLFVLQNALPPQFSFPTLLRFIDFTFVEGQVRKGEDVVMVERIRDVEVEEDIYRTGEREMGEKFGGGLRKRS